MNVELARKALASIREYPANHSQSSWVTGSQYVTEEHKPECGTSMCFAGWVAFHVAPIGSRLTDSGAVVMPNGETARVSQYARTHLGINFLQSDPFFFGADTADDLEVLIEALADDPDISDTDLYLAIGINPEGN